MKEQRFEDLPIGTNKAFALNDGRVVVRRNDEYFDNAFCLYPFLHIVSIEQERIVTHFEGRVGIKQH